MWVWQGAVSGHVHMGVVLPDSEVVTSGRGVRNGRGRDVGGYEGRESVYSRVLSHNRIVSQHYTRPNDILNNIIDCLGYDTNLCIELLLNFCLT